MLILTRRVGETVMIGNDVTVTILGVKGNQVRVGVNAPARRGSASRRNLRAHQAGRTGRWNAFRAAVGCPRQRPRR